MTRRILPALLILAAAATTAGGNVTIADDGSFIVNWTSYEGNGDGMGVFGRIIGPTGSPSGADSLVNEATAYDQNFSSLAAGPSNDFVVVWQDDYLDGDQEAVIGQHFFLPAPALLGPMGPLDCSDPSDPLTIP
jgi:hypothetical protein